MIKKRKVEKIIYKYKEYKGININKLLIILIWIWRL